MIPIANLKAIARARLRDSKVLLKGKRLDGAVYLCGYAVEIALKARICRTLKWSEFPETTAEFQCVLNWDPDKRYQTTGGFTEQQARDVVAAATKLLRVI